MSCYALYYRPPPMVHNPQHPTVIYTNPEFESQSPSAEQSSEGTLPTMDGVETTPERNALPKSRLTMNSLPPTKVDYEQFQSPLMRLPAELRNKIYSLLLCAGTFSMHDLQNQENKDFLSLMGYNHTATHSPSPQVLSTCRKIHDEASGLLYSRHIFHAHPSLLSALPHLSTSTRPVTQSSVTSLIKRWSLSLRLDIDPRFTYSAAKAAFSGAEYLELHVWQAQFEACDFSVLKLFMGVRGVKVVRVGGSVSKELAEYLERVMMMEEGDVVDDGVCHCREEGKKVVCQGCGGNVGDLRQLDVWRFGGR